MMKIKNFQSQCIAMFETEEQAQAARERFHNVKWPDLNDKVLKVDYTTKEEVTLFNVIF